MFPNLPILPEFFQVLPILPKFGLQLITSSKQHPKCNPSSLSVGTIESAQGQEVEGCDDQTWGQWDNHRQTRYKQIFLMGKSPMNGGFYIAMFDYQRVQQGHGGYIPGYIYISKIGNQTHGCLIHVNGVSSSTILLGFAFGIEPTMFGWRQNGYIIMEYNYKIVGSCWIIINLAIFMRYLLGSTGNSIYIYIIYIIYLICGKSSSLASVDYTPCRKSNTPGHQISSPELPHQRCLQ